MCGRRVLVEIDLTGATTAGELHLLLLHALDFPGWYGCNWDAFRDAITGLVEMPHRLRLRDWSGLAASLPDDARLMRECLDEMATLYPDRAAEVEYA